MQKSLTLKLSKIGYFCEDLVSCGDEELTNFDTASEIKQQEDMLSEDDSYYALAVNKVLGTSINLEAAS